MKTDRLDIAVLALVGSVLVWSAVVLVKVQLSGEDLGAWIWDRHQNPFSWYSRPLFIIPACYYAWRRKPLHVIGFLLLLFTSLFWFAAPDHVPERVSDFLEWEKQLFFTNQSSLPLLALIVTVALFLFGLFLAFWKRNLWYGLILINVGTLLKIVFSVAVGKEVGMAAIVPSLTSLAVVNSIAFLIWRFRGRPANADGRT